MLSNHEETPNVTDVVAQAIFLETAGVEVIQGAQMIKEYGDDCVVISLYIYHKIVQETGLGTRCTLAPSHSVNVAILAVGVQVDGVQCLVLINTGFSRSIVSVDRCRE